MLHSHNAGSGTTPDCVEKMSEPIEIARYPNRRLYDRSQKKYVTLGDIEAVVLAGKAVRVRDSKSEEDLTGVILTQIILERHPERMKVFSVPFLHALLRADQLVIDWLTVYFGQAMKLMKGATAMPIPGFPGFEMWKSVVPDSPAENEHPSPDPASNDQPDLSERLSEMERRLQQLENRKDQ